MKELVLYIQLNHTHYEHFILRTVVTHWGQIISQYV